MVMVLAAVAGISLSAMMLVTCADVILRIFARPITGAYDIVRIAGVVTIAAALPYTTAVKGHVAVEYFFHKLSHRGRFIVDSVVRVVGIAAFLGLAWQSVIYGSSLRQTGEVTLTLQIPVFWIPYVIGASSIVMALVVGYHLFEPGRELIKP
jgi:TRAP-type C4-dicarboxylate transport system permease small subunit